MSVNGLDDRLAAARRALDAAGQSHVLQFWDRLRDDERAELLAQVASVDWPEVTRLVQTHVLNKPRFTLPHNVQPAPWYPNVPPAELREKYEKARRGGEALIRRGKVAAFTVAGGQGTRLGWDGPKGAYPATPVRGLPLFGCMAEFLLKTQDKYGAVVPWYIMTSPHNHAATRAFFEQNGYCGLAPRNVVLFPQAMMPAIDLRSGKVLLEALGSMALSPNGHGGSLKALYTRGATADMRRRGIEQISYTQVDNPIVRFIDPLFIGLHAMDGCQMSSKMLPKREPLEKLGNFCLIDGQMTVIEYSDLPDDLAHERLPSGQLRFLAGSIAIHVLRVDFVEALNKGTGDRSQESGVRNQGTGDRGQESARKADESLAVSQGFSLPFHRAEKKVPYIDPASGELVKPDQPNAVKLETFVFDALPLCQRSIIYETDRADEFGPIKNADAPPGSPPGSVLDCPATSRQLQIERAARWLEAAGVKVPRKADGTVDAVIELTQRTAIEPEDLKAPGVTLPKEIRPGARIVI